MIQPAEDGVTEQNDRGRAMKTHTAILAVLAMTATVGCSEQQQPGPAEKAGKQIDQAVQQAEQKTQAALEKAEQYTGEKMEEAGKTLEDAGGKLKE
jgi:hypothetical protein